jgi:hypothetical protein
MIDVLSSHTRGGDRGRKPRRRQISVRRNLQYFFPDACQHQLSRGVKYTTDIADLKSLRL